MRKILVLLLLLAIPSTGGYYYWQHATAPSIVFRTATVERGDLLSSISATGTVEPVEVIDVGAQIAGKIRAFGEDPSNPGKTVDYGSQVEEGTVLARIDDELYAADVERGLAELEQAKANVLRAQADLGQLKAKLIQAEHNWKRAQELGSSRALSATDYDSYKATYETAKATVAVGEATVVQNEKAVLQAEAALKRSKTNLGYCIIKSPVKGVIIDRRVNIGQTVVASLNAPSLFLIAKDLTKIQVWVAVNEADIGQVHPGQPVSFTVDAFGGQSFRGEVGKIRLNASMTQNVVTYTVEVNTDNSDGQLLPYLTASVRFEVARRENVLRVPNAALRWEPSVDQVAPEYRAGFKPKLRVEQMSQREIGTNQRGQRTGEDAAAVASPPGDKKPASQPVNGPRKATLWVKDGDFLKPVEVACGLTDGSVTEVSGDQLRENMEVVTGQTEQTAQEEGRNPFLPKLFGNRRS